jgi:transposase InsO family protein
MDPRTKTVSHASSPGVVVAEARAVMRRGHGRVPPELRQHALLLVASGMKAVEVARRIGVSHEALRLWRRRAEAEGTMPEAPGTDAESRVATERPRPALPQRAPKDPGAGLSAHEVEAILELKRRHPSMGPAQIRAQLKRFRGWRLATRAIARVLKQHGFELVHTGSRPQGEAQLTRFEAPHRNALWQMDFAEFRVGADRVSLLVMLDDFSRFVVGHALLEEVTSEKVVEALTQAIRRHGKPWAVYTDRGGPFLAWSKPSAFKSFLERELIDHHVSAAYRPQGRGKVEAWIATLRREFWDVAHFASLDDARRALGDFVRHYNEGRAHLGIDGLTPADRFFGRWEAVRERVETVSRRRQVLAATAPGRDPFVIEEGDGALEVLRFMAVDGRLRIHFLGHRLDLGRLEP